MSVIDVIFLIVFAGSITFGVWRGFSREVISVITLVCAIFFSFQLSPSLVELTKGWHDGTSALALVIAFFCIFFIVILIGKIVFYLIHSFIRSMDLMGWEKFGGGVFGLIRAMLILMIFTLVFDSLSHTMSLEIGARAYSMVMARQVNDKLGLAWSEEDMKDILGDIDLEIDEEIEIEIDDAIKEEVKEKIIESFTGD